MSEPIIDKMGMVWESIDRLCSTFSGPEWAAETECPGWTVQDQLAHLVGPETGLLGRPQPEHSVPPRPHVRNPIGANNEVAVDYRRSRSGQEVLAEFREVTSERMKALRGLTEDELSADSWTPIGPGSYRDLLDIRVFDAWVHEQDIRRAVNRPGDLEGPVAEHSLRRCFQAMPFVVGKNAMAPDGVTVLIDVEGPTSARLAIGVEDGRARVVDALGGSPTVGLTLGFEAFTRLCCGRWDPRACLERGDVVVRGDEELGRRIVERMAFMI